MKEVLFLTVSKNQQEHVSKYVRGHYDRIQIYLIPKGKKDIIKAQAGKIGLSVNSYINMAIDEKIERDNSPDTKTD